VQLSALLFPLVLAAAPAPGAECVAHSTRERPHLVELYTSEGCSSCPPAERWMSSIRDDAAQVGLEFHVDYWDELGWPDPFADARYTARQRTLAERGSNAIVYTPQLVVDGRVWKNWPATPAPVAASASASPALSVQVSRTNAIRATLDGEAANAAPYRMFVALTENGLDSTVRAGENKGKRLAHDQVVRDFAGPFPFPRAEATLDPPPGLDAAKSSVVAFIEDERTGDVVQVVRLALAQCPAVQTSEQP
jgi:hypothetical protein